MSIVGVEGGGGSVIIVAVGILDLSPDSPPGVSRFWLFLGELVEPLMSFGRCCYSYFCSYGRCCGSGGGGQFSSQVFQLLFGQENRELTCTCNAYPVKHFFLKLSENQ